MPVKLMSRQLMKLIECRESNQGYTIVPLLECVYPIKFMSCLAVCTMSGCSLIEDTYLLLIPDYSLSTIPTMSTLFSLSMSFAVSSLCSLAVSPVLGGAKPMATIPDLQWSHLLSHSACRFTHEHGYCNKIRWACMF